MHDRFVGVAAIHDHLSGDGMVSVSVERWHTVMGGNRVRGGPQIEARYRDPRGRIASERQLGGEVRLGEMGVVFSSRSAVAASISAVEVLVSHRYFQPHVTPVQVFHRATNPVLPNVRPHTLAVLDLLDAPGLTNHVLVITRHQMKPEDIERLNQLRHLKVTLLFTYSSIDNKDLEPYPSYVAAESLKPTTFGMTTVDDRTVPATFAHRNRPTHWQTSTRNGSGAVRYSVA